MGTHRIRVVDVFTSTAFEGNQLAVVLDAAGIPDAVMQSIARELNLSETVFVTAPRGDADVDVRIFTPTVELPFAGHPTVGTAWVVRDEGLVQPGSSRVVLGEKIGNITVEVEDAMLWMAHPPVEVVEEVPEVGGVLDAIGLGAEAVIPGAVPAVMSTGVPFLYIALRDRATVDRAVPDAGRLENSLPGREKRSVFIFAPDGEGRLYSRMFAPHVVGILEDPATGSASGPLGPYAVRAGLVPRADRVNLVSEQGVKMGRRSLIHLRLGYGSGELPERVEVGGHVTPVITGNIQVP